MKNLCLTFFVIMMSVFVGNSFEEESKRVKRVVNGYEMWGNQVYHYKAFEYYVWIGETWNRCYHADRAWWNLWGLSPAYNFGDVVRDIANDGQPACRLRSQDFICSGALITPRVVQSACHCFVMQRVINKKYFFNKVLLNEDLDEKYEIFMGSTLTSAMRDPIYSKKIILHERCSIISIGPQMMLYDFAWVFIQKNVADGDGVVSGSWGRQLDYAGPYRKAEIIGDFDMVLKQEHVCLILGFGNPVHEEVTSDPSKLQQMRIGYVQMMNWFACFHWVIEFTGTYDITVNTKEYFHDHYNNTHSWACAHSLRNPYQIGGHGDSGGPVSCNGQYFAVLSGLTPDEEAPPQWTIRRINRTNMFHPIRYVLEANAVEFRRAFEEVIFGYSHSFSGSDEFRSLKKIPLNTKIRNTSTQFDQNTSVQSCPLATQMCFVSMAMIFSMSLVWKINMFS